MSFETHEIEQMMRQAQMQREREAPRTRRQMENRVTIAVAMALGSCWERQQAEMPALPEYPGFPPPPETPKTRMIRLFERDPMFYHTVKQAVSLIMRGIEDYELTKKGRAQ